MMRRQMQSDALLHVLSEYADTAVVVHDHPDPDAIAGGWALTELIQSKLRKPAQWIARGEITRAENVRMINLLEPPLRIVDRVRLPRRCAGILVDCCPSASNHLLAGRTAPPVAVIDHHASNATEYSVRYQDVRPQIAASASILCSYLQEQRITPSWALATALLYGIRTETHGDLAKLSTIDAHAIDWLTPQADHGKLADIECAPLTRAYFSDLLLALERTFLYEDAALCYLPRASGPEVVGEMADLLIRCNEAHSVLCAATIGPDIVLSVRTTRHAGDAVGLLRLVLGTSGDCGGHRHRAGGRISDGARMDRNRRLRAQIRRRWLTACKVDPRRGYRLALRRRVSGLW